MSQTVKVGIFMTVVLVVAAYLIFRIEDLPFLGGAGQVVEAEFESVAGLDEKSPVRVAGVKVGQVESIQLVPGGARVALRLVTPVELVRGANARIANLGILGDKYVELDPGPAGAPALADGAVLAGTTPPSFDDAIGRFGELGDSLGSALGGIDGQKLGPILERLLTNLEATSEDVRLLVRSNRGQIDSTVANFERLSGTLADELPGLAAQMEALVAEIQAVVSDNRGNVEESFANAAELTESLRTAVDDLGVISGKIARGEGTIGKLVSSEETHDQLVSTLSAVETGVGELQEVFGRVKKIQLDLGFDSYYLEEIEDYRNSFAVDIDPQSGRTYHVAVVDDPRGRTRTKTDEVTVVNPDGSVETTTTQRVSTEEKLTLSAQVGLNFGSARVRTGVFESKGGAAFDYTFLDRKFSLSLEAFDFNRDNDLAPRLRLSGRWYAGKGFFLIGGLDDALESNQDSIFFGGGVRWRDDDLKYLAGSVPSF